MKSVPIITLSLLSLLSFQSSLAKEEILPWDALRTEKQFRSTIEARFPDLDFGFYHFTGDWFMAALEDFDRDRILLIPIEHGVEKVTISRNGKEIPMPIPPTDHVNLKVAGVSITPEGKVSDNDNPIEHRIGFWINLEATDTLSIAVKINSPAKSEFTVTYDPDLRWQITSQPETNEKDKKKPADAYEISRKSLLKRVLEVLAKQDECLVRLKQPSDLIITTREVDNDSDINALYLVLSNKIEIGTGENVEMTPANKLNEHIQLYGNAARSAGDNPRIIIQVNAETDDQIFRDTLIALAKHQFSQVRLIVNQADKK